MSRSGGDERAGRSLLAAAAARLSRGEPFVLATVVWRRGPSSSHQGAKALIGPTGAVQGWLGGACAQPSVVAEALAALGDGRPRLLLLGPAEEFGTRTGDDLVRVPMACESEGAMEVYLEPMLPAPHVVVVGSSPAAAVLAQLAEDVGWRATVVEDLGGAAVDRRTYVVVATQGHHDEPALEAALATDAGYVGLVASRKRADSVFEYLRGRGVSDEALARVRAPAGLDLGSLEHEEIAVAILAELVALRAGGSLPAGVEVEAPRTATDPVCGMTVDVVAARFTAEYEGATYYFCAAGCRTAFERDPAGLLT